MAKRELCKVADFPKDGRGSFKIGEKSVAVFLIENNYYAISQKCTHMGGNLAKGKLNGKIIKCPLHGAEYSLETGELVQQVGKLAGMLKKAKNAEVYPISLENDILFVDL